MYYFYNWFKKVFLVVKKKEVLKEGNKQVKTYCVRGNAYAND